MIVKIYVYVIVPNRQLLSNKRENVLNGFMFAILSAYNMMANIIVSLSAILSKLLFYFTFINVYYTLAQFPRWKIN